MSNTQQKPTVQQPAPQQAKNPNDKGNVVVHAHMKIFDPQTKQVYVEGRA